LKILKAIDKNFERYLTIALFIWVIGWAFFQVLSRYIFKSIYWSGTEEVCRYFYIWMIMLGASMLTLDEAHLKVDILNVIIGDHKMEYVNIFWALVQIAFYIILIPYAWQWAFTTLKYGKLYPSSNMPQAWFQFSFLVLCVLCVIRNIEVIIKHIVSLRKAKGLKSAEKEGEN